MTRNLVDRRPDHGPGQGRVGRAPRQLGIDEIADPSGGIAQRHQWCNEIHDSHQSASDAPRPDKHCQQHAEKATVKRHAAFPDGKDFQWIRKVMSRCVEQHFAQAAADDHAQHAIEQHVVEVFLAPAGERHVRLPYTQPAECDELRERQEIHQAVPAYRQRANGQGYRIRHGVNQHCVLSQGARQAGKRIIYLTRRSAQGNVAASYFSQEPSWPSIAVRKTSRRA